MKHFYTLVLLYFISVITNIATAQTNYVKAYIVNNTGDTIKGLIDYKNWGMNPDKIHFKSSPQSEVFVFTPTSIRTFCVSDELYYSAEVQMEVSPEVSNLDKYADLNLVTDSVFLQTLVQGSKSLFYYKSPAGKSNFYIFSNGKYELLQHKKYIKTTSKDIVIAENKKYVGQLIIYFNDCEYLKSKIGKIKYSQRSLVNSFDSYYRCTRETVSFKKKEEKIKFEKGIFAGGSSTTLTVKGGDIKDIPHFSTSKNLAMGLSFDVVLPRNQRKWSIVNELNFPSYHMEDNFINKAKDTVYIEMGYRYVKINNMLRFSYPIKVFRIFINAGMGNGLALIETNYMKTIPDGPFFNSPKEGQFIKSRKYEQSILGGAGVRWKSISLELRSEYGNGMSRYPLLSTKTLRHYLLFGFKF